MEFVCVELLSEQPLTQDVAADVVSIDGSAVSGSKLITSESISYVVKRVCIIMMISIYISIK